LQQWKSGVPCGHATAGVWATEIEIDIEVKGVSNMGKYVLGWILGVPVIVLVIFYMLFN
jgi:hypothetical protein